MTAATLWSDSRHYQLVLNMNNMFSESPHGKVGVVAHACNPSTLQMEKGRPPPPPSASLKPAYAVNKKSPPAMVSPMGWKCMLVFPKSNWMCYSKYRRWNMWHFNSIFRKNDWGSSLEILRKELIGKSSRSQTLWLKCKTLVQTSRVNKRVKH